MFGQRKLLKYILKRKRTEKQGIGKKGCKKTSVGREKSSEEVGLTFFGVARCVLAGVANHPVEVSGSVFKHVIPEKDKIHGCKPGTC